MKTLQKDITTPEQAERLLKLGVPKVTANYYYDSRDFKPQAHEVRGHWNEEDDRASRHGYKITPLWSVGRLIEMWEICVGVKFDRWPRKGVLLPLTEDCMEHIEFALNPYTKIEFDFSKLEE